MKKISAISFFIAVLFLQPRLVLADAHLLEGADMAYGEYLSSECATCHKVGGNSTNIPSINGIDAEAFAAIMHGYRNRELDNPTMQTIAARLSDEEIASLAVYFSTLKP